MKTLHGHLLVASPKLLDPNFHKTVVLMVQHNDEGALGLILNRSMDTTIHDVWHQISDKPCTSLESLHHGGPCEAPLMVVHGHALASQIEVVSDVHFTTERENVEWLLEHNDEPIKFFVGCSGWAPGQLEAELKTGSWLATPATHSQIFNGGKNQWDHVTERISRSMSFPPIDPNVVPPEDPSMN